MKKSALIAAGMAVALFLYGYLLTGSDHDHDNHAEENTEYQHAEHNH